jgi:hypothetical protein
MSDPSTGLISASLRVVAVSPFVLAAPEEQDRLLGAFGDALGPLSTDKRLVSLRWSSFASPAGAPLSTGLVGPAAASYRELVGLVGTASHHEVLLTPPAWRRTPDRTEGRRHELPADERRL